MVDMVVELSYRLAALIGKPVVRPTPQGVLYDDFRAMVRNAELQPMRDRDTAKISHEESMDSGTSYLWYKCTVHGTWMQPECKPFDHWKCAVKGCTQIKPAKKRTAIERRIFNVHRWQEQENG